MIDVIHLYKLNVLSNNVGQPKIAFSFSMYKELLPFGFARQNSSSELQKKNPWFANPIQPISYTVAANSTPPLNNLATEPGRRLRKLSQIASGATAIFWKMAYHQATVCDVGPAVTWSWMMYPGKHEAFTQCCFNIGPASSTLAQHWDRIAWMPLVCWDVASPLHLCGDCFLSVAFLT